MYQGDLEDPAAMTARFSPSPNRASFFAVVLILDIDGVERV